MDNLTNDDNNNNVQDNNNHFPDILLGSTKKHNHTNIKSPNTNNVSFASLNHQNQQCQQMIGCIGTMESSIQQQQQHYVSSTDGEQSSLPQQPKVPLEKQDNDVGEDNSYNDGTTPATATRFIEQHRTSSSLSQDDFASLLPVSHHLHRPESSTSNQSSSHLAQQQQQQLKPRASSFSETPGYNMNNRQRHHPNFDYPNRSFLFTQQHKTQQNDLKHHPQYLVPGTSTLQTSQMNHHTNNVGSPYHISTPNNSWEAKQTVENGNLFHSVDDNNDMTSPLLLSDHNSDNTNNINDTNHANNSDATSINNVGPRSVMNNIEHFMNSTMIIWNEIWDIQSHEEFISWLRIWLRQLMRRMGNYLAYCTLIIMLILVPVVLYNALHLRKLDTAAFNSAYVMVCGTIVLSTRLVYLHLTHWYMPEVQKYVVRILWMVPIYAIQSYFSLRFHNSRVYITSIRDFYEAYVIASFVYYLIELLGGQESIIMILQNKDPTIYGKHKFPFKYVLNEWNLGLEFMIQCKYGVLQYVVFKTTLTILVFFCESIGIYGEGKFTWYVAYPYFCFFQNISVMYALYCLVLFFHVVNDELITPINWHPLGKFVCIKGVVFFTWWQGVIIFYLKDHNIISALGSWTSQQVANGLIDYCIVIEMVGFAIAHSYTFTYIEYLPSTMIQYQQQFIEQEQQLYEQQQLQYEQQQLQLQQQPNESREDNAASDQYQSNMQPSSLMENSSERLCISPVCDDSKTPMMIIPTTNGSTTPTPYPGGSGGLVGQQGQQLASSYRPPATLPRPMKFTDALWSSTVPTDTINDIKKIRVNIDNIIEEAHRERSSGSQDYVNNFSNNNINNRSSSRLLWLLNSNNDDTNTNNNHSVDQQQTTNVNEEQEIVFTPHDDLNMVDAAMVITATDQCNNIDIPSAQEDESNLFPDLLLDLIVDNRSDNNNSKTEKGKIE